MKINEQMKIQAMYNNQIAGGPKPKQEPVKEPVVESNSPTHELSDAQIRGVIKDVSGKTMAGRAGRATLIAEFDRLNEEES